MKVTASIVVGVYVDELGGCLNNSHMLSKYTIFRNPYSARKDIVGLPIISTVDCEPLKLECFRHEMAERKDTLKEDFGVDAGVFLVNS